MKQENNNTEKTYRILYLEDNYEETVSEEYNKVKEFKSRIENNHPDVQIKIVKEPIYKKMDLRVEKTNMIIYDAVICDINIWENSEEDGIRELSYLGFKYIQWFKPYNIIRVVLSDVTTRLHAKINEEIHPKLIKLKSDVFKSDDTIDDFIKEIKSLIDNKHEKDKEPRIGRGRRPKDKGGYRQFFKDCYSYIKDEEPIIVIRKKKKKPIIFKNYTELERFIVEQFEKLKIIFDDKYKSCNGKIPVAFIGDSIKKDPDIINISYVKEYPRKTSSNESVFDWIGSFIVKLIARRLLIYVLLRYNIKNEDLHKIFSTEPYTQYLSTSLLFPSTINKSSIWDERTENIPDDRDVLLTDEEVAYIKDFMKSQRL